MLRVCTFASGSSGNCTFVSDGTTHILIDAGISCRRIMTALRSVGVSPEQLSAILLTHEHSDHVSGLGVLTSRCQTALYATPGTARAVLLCGRIPTNLMTFITPGEHFTLGGLDIGSFRTSHDSAESCGYTVSDGEHTMALCTDLGYVSGEVLAGIGAPDLLIAETNHDPVMLANGPYPPHLKNRIRSDRGHLSNEVGAGLAVRCVQAGCRTVVLAHLSDKNNTPALARNAVVRAMRQAGIDPERDVTVAVAPRSEPGPVYTLGGGDAL